MSKVKSPKKMLSDVIRADDYQGFCEFMKNRHKMTSTNDVLMPSTYEILQSICSHRAELCLYALLDNKTTLVDVELEGGLYPLHIAAQSLWFDGTVILLSDNTCVSEWNSKISIFKLLFIFCLPELKEPLETVKLLASKTEQLEMISLRCVLQGEVVQLTALLWVAWDKLVKPFTDQGIKCCPIGELILNELRRDQENRFSQSFCSSIEIHEHEVNLENAWKVLEILDIARNTIEDCRLSYPHKDVPPHLVPFHVASSLWTWHKIYLEPEDRVANDVKCLRPRLTTKQKAWLYRSIDKQIRSVSNFPTLSERSTAGRVWSSHSFHTLNPNLVKPVRSQLSQACQKPGTGFSNFLRSSGTHIPRLISTLKRM